MPDTITDRFNKKQNQINQLRDEAVARYPSSWSKMIAEWNQPGTDDHAWLMYAANYLFRTNNVRWAMDPLTLNWRIKNAPKVDAAHDLSGLSFVLLTHRHNDHLDIDMLSALRYLPITWVVPEFILTEVVEQAGLPRKNIIVTTPLEPIELNGIRILPFDGLHWETTPDGSLKGVPATGYLIEFNGRRWLFPGDTRTYDTSQLPSTGPVDRLFAHLWLGRGCALMDDPPLLDAFCHFCLDLQPRRVILTHLNEFGRDAEDFWDESHTHAVRTRFREISAGAHMSQALMGESVLL
jgi:L-ascorbate metabolism protein UlaG (beta-lactamase superfamily)